MLAEISNHIEFIDDVSYDDILPRRLDPEDYLNTLPIQEYDERRRTFLRQQRRNRFYRRIR